MKKLFKGVGFAVLGLVAVAILLRLFILDVVILSGEDMMPGLGDDTLVLVRRGATPQRGDLVMFKSPHGYLVRRVVAMPGEKIATQKGVPVIDGREAKQEEVRTFTNKGRKFRVMKETLADHTWEIIDDTMRTMSDLKETEVGQGYFVLADHREHARDSREYGPIAADRVRGVVIWTW